MSVELENLMLVVLLIGTTLPHEILQRLLMMSMAMPVAAGSRWPPRQLQPRLQTAVAVDHAEEHAGE